MSDQYEAELRGRLVGTALPAAPARLHDLAVAISREMPLGSERRRPLVGWRRMLMPLVAALAIAAVAVSSWGSGPRPTDSGFADATDPSPGPAAGTFTVESRIGEWCHQIGGCEFHVTLDGPGGPWAGMLEFASLGSPTGITPTLPELLSPGAYELSAEIHILGDAIPEGASGPPDLGTIGMCSSEFEVTPETTTVQATLGFWLDRCSAGTIVSTDAMGLSEFKVVSSINGDCGEFGCEYRVRLVGSNGSWQTVLQSPKLPDELVPGSGLPRELPPGTYSVEASSHRMSDEPFPGAGHRQEESVAATCAAQASVRPDELASFEAHVHFRAETCAIEIFSKIADVSRPTPTPGATSPIDSPAASPKITCEPNPTDLPGLDCHGAINAVLAVLQPGQPPIDTALFMHQCWSISPSLVVDCAVEAMGIVEITFLGFSGVSRYGVSGLPWTGVTVTPLTPVMFGPVYPASPPIGRGMPIERAELSDDRRTLTVEFWAGGCFTDDVPWVESRGDELLVGIFNVAWDIPWPPGVACALIAFKRTYHLMLPSPWSGSTLRDFNGGALVLE